jgi:TolB-like protein/Tfp pilus assembly protein PilF
MGLFSELRRRNVYRMAVLYAVTSWLIMQAAEVVMTLASLPEWTGRLTLILLAIGFPIALVLSWFYELTPEGISLEKDIRPGESITHVTGRRLDFIVIALLCAGLLVFAYDKWWMSGPPITSVAVLPLESLSSDPEQGYFADGMTEVLTAQLAQIESLRVISRTSAMHYKDTDMSLPDIARELGADAIVEGSIQPAGDEVRFTIQLIDGRTDRHLWSRSYLRDLGDVLSLQGEIARAISGEIEITLTPQSEARLARDRAVDRHALRLWAVGNHHLKGFSEDSFDKALQAFQEAVRLDPDFADAYAGIAQTYTFLGSWHAARAVDTVLPLAKAAAEKAIQLDPDLAEAHFALAGIHRLDWEWEDADREYRKGRGLDPSDTLGLVEYANFLTAMGRSNLAIEVATHAVKLDPLSPGAHNELGGALWFAGQDEAAFKKFWEALQLDPEFFQTQWVLSDYYTWAGEYDKALPFLERLKQDFETLAPVMIGLVGANFAMAGRRDDALEMLAHLLKRTETEYIPGSAFAYLYAGLDDFDETVAWLEVAYEQQDLSMIFLKVDPNFAALHSDARFQEILSRMDFPETNGNRDL